MGIVYDQETPWTPKIVYDTVPITGVTTGKKKAIPSLIDASAAMNEKFFGPKIAKFLPSNLVKAGYEGLEDISDRLSTFASKDMPDNKLIPTIPTSKPDAFGNETDLNKVAKVANSVLSGITPKSLTKFGVESFTSPEAIGTMAVTGPGAGIAKGFRRATTPFAEGAETNLIDTLTHMDWRDFGKLSSNLQAGASNFVKSSLGRVKSQNSRIYGKALDAIDAPITREQFENAASRIVGEIDDPNLMNTPAYSKLKSVLSTHASNESELASASAKKAMEKTLRGKIARGEFVDPKELESLVLTEAEQAALKYPRIGTDLIDARTLQQARREVRSVSKGQSAVNHHVADNFDFALGENLGEISALNQEYKPVLQASNKAFKLFNPRDEFATGGEKFLQELGNKSTFGSMSPTDSKFLDVLTNGSGRFVGVGKNAYGKSLNDIVAQVAKLKRQGYTNSAIKLLLTSTGSGLGLFKARAAGKSSGLF